MNISKIIELATKLKKLEAYLPEYHRTLKLQDAGGFKLDITDGVLDVTFSCEDSNLLTKAVLHTWDEHPHNGSIYNKQKQVISEERSVLFLEIAIIRARLKAKEAIKERLIDQLVEKELTSQGL